MSRTSAINHLIAGFIAAALGACGGSQQAEPEAPSSTTQEPATDSSEGATPKSEENTGSSGDGTHTMPDGTTMPGHHHGEGTPEGQQ